MTDHVTDGSPAADDLLARLDQVADHLIEARRLAAALGSPEFDVLRMYTDVALMEVGRCIAREFGTLQAVRAAEAAAYENCEA